MTDAGQPGPEDAATGAATLARDRAATLATDRAATLAAAAVDGDRRALARLLTAVENRTPVAEAALRILYPKAGRAHLVGITGAPGAGKSTLVAALIAEIRAAGRPVAVLAVDPSSPITGGALLGDRVRMQGYATDDGVFIRSMASRGHAGGLAATSAAAAAVLDAAGFDVVLLETVGTGQSEVEVAAAADTTVVLEAPEMGDEVQAIKAGLLEVADLVVVNKGDRPGAQRTAAQLRAMLSLTTGPTRSAERQPGPPAGTGSGAGGGTPVSPGAPEDVPPEDVPPEDVALRPRPKRPAVLVTTAMTGEGVPALLAAIDAHRTARHDEPTTRLARAGALVWALVGERVRSRLDTGARAPGTAAILRDVAEHALDPYEAADRLLAALD